MSMLRTQVYLTEQERKALKTISKQIESTQSELIRQAVDLFVARHRGENRLALLRQASGMWKDRADLPDFSDLRRELDRSP